jgi:hypothetical protein
MGNAGQTWPTPLAPFTRNAPCTLASQAVSLQNKTLVTRLRERAMRVSGGVLRSGPADSRGLSVNDLFDQWATISWSSWRPRGTDRRGISSDRRGAPVAGAVGLEPPAPWVWLHRQKRDVCPVVRLDGSIPSPAWIQSPLRRGRDGQFRSSSSPARAGQSLPIRRQGPGTRVAI